MASFERVVCTCLTDCAEVDKVMLVLKETHLLIQRSPLFLCDLCVCLPVLCLGQRRHQCVCVCECADVCASAPPPPPPPPCVKVPAMFACSVFDLVLLEMQTCRLQL